MNNKSKIFKNSFTKKIHNNQSLFRSDNHILNKHYDNRTVRQKIDEILKDKSFIYRISVHLVIDNKVIERKIIGVYNDNLVTIENEYIPISKIIDVYK